MWQVGLLVDDPVQSGQLDERYTHTHHLCFWVCLFLSLVFNFVRVENPCSHVKVVVSENNETLILYNSGYSLKTLIQNDGTTWHVFSVLSQVNCNTSFSFSDIKFRSIVDSDFESKRIFYPTFSSWNFKICLKIDLRLSDKAARCSHGTCYFALFFFH